MRTCTLGRGPSRGGPGSLGDVDAEASWGEDSPEGWASPV